MFNGGLCLRLKIDLHVHTPHSDGSGTIRDILRAAESKGLDGLAITDHEILDGYFEAKSHGSSLIILPGYEVTTDAGHVLIIGLEDKLPPNIGSGRPTPYSKVVDWAKLNDGLTILAHPAIRVFKLDKWMRHKPDAVEVLNSLYPLNYFVKRGLSVSLALGVAGVGGSDAHSPLNVGDAYTILDLDGEPSERNIKEAIRRNRATYGGSLSPLSTRLRIGVNFLFSRHY
ncbi:MAG: CehA/McbA family metallohydrolase [Candidatus Bathyarchaeota archaeon]|nr:CehA/McbA family metallohydrolase [Candidatus Bathyarchaeota archaeon]